jgi:hypothetical protein
MPLERGNLPVEVQEAYHLHDMLSDRWDGMNGYYLGKDYTALDTYIKVLKIEDVKTTLYFLKHIEYYNSDTLNKKIKQKRDAEERKQKSR